MTKARPDGSGTTAWHLTNRVPDAEDYRRTGMVDESGEPELDGSLNEDNIDSDRADRKAAVDGEVDDSV